jgi:hypothetical protein
MSLTVRGMIGVVVIGLVVNIGLLKTGDARAALPSEVMTVTTLYSQQINPVNAVHPLWTPVQHYRGKTFVVCPDVNLRPLVTQIDHEGHVTTVFLDTCPDPVYFASPDGHNRFTMGIDKNGYIHIIGDMHGYAPWAGRYTARYQYQSIMYWRSNKALDVTGGFTFCGGLNDTTRLPGVEYGGDSRFFNDRNGELYFSSRVRAFEGSTLGGSEPFIAYGMYRYNTSNGVWTALGGKVDPADAPGARNFNTVLYWEYTHGFEAYQSQPRFDNNNRLHFSIAGNTAGTEGSGLIYAYSDDCGLTWKKANGTPIPGLPLRGKDGVANQGDLIDRSTSVAQQSSVSTDKDGKLNVAGRTWTGTGWAPISGGSGILGPDNMLTAEGGHVLYRAACIGQPAIPHPTGFGQVFSTCELAIQNENVIYGIGLPPGNNFVNATRMSVYKARFRPSENVAKGGVASAHAGHAEALFDGSPEVKWLAGGGGSGWLQYRFADGVTWSLGSYSLTSGNDMPGRDPKNWEFKGSNNGKDWITLDIRKDEIFATRLQTKTYTLSNHTAYAYYRLEITANNGGSEIQLGEMTLNGRRLPSAPLLFKPVPDNGKIWLSWNACAFATCYHIKRSTVSGGPYTTIATDVTATDDFVDSKVVNGKAYYYVVSAKGPLGEGPDSEQVCAIPEDRPLAPIVQKAVGGNGNVLLQWVPLWPSAMRYTVKRAATQSGPYRVIARGVSTLQYTDTGLKNGEDYYYVVSATGPRGVVSPDSTPIKGTPFRYRKILKYWSIDYDPSVQGVASASAENPPREKAAQAFDGTGGKWLAMANTCWLQYRFADGVKWAVTRYTLISGGDGPERDPKDWIFEGSNDGQTWVTLDTQVGQVFPRRNMEKTYDIDNLTSYQYYRLNITANAGNGITQLAELVLWADGDVLPAPRSWECFFPRRAK